MQPCRRFAHEKIGLIHVNQKGYPECLVDNRSPWGCSTDKGTPIHLGVPEQESRIAIIIQGITDRGLPLDAASDQAAKRFIDLQRYRDNLVGETFQHFMHHASGSGERHQRMTRNQQRCCENYFFRALKTPSLSLRTMSRTIVKQVAAAPAKTVRSGATASQHSSNSLYTHMM